MTSKVFKTKNACHSLRVCSQHFLVYYLGVSRESVLNFSAGIATNTRVGGFVRAVRCRSEAHTEIAFFVSFLVI